MSNLFMMKRPVNPHLVKTLEGLLEQANKGEISSILVMVKSDGHNAEMMLTDGIEDMPTIVRYLGLCHMAQDYLMKKVGVKR